MLRQGPKPRIGFYALCEEKNVGLASRITMLCATPCRKSAVSCTCPVQTLRRSRSPNDRSGETLKERAGCYCQERLWQLPTRIGYSQPCFFFLSSRSFTRALQAGISCKGQSFPTHMQNSLTYSVPPRSTRSPTPQWCSAHQPCPQRPLVNCCNTHTQVLPESAVSHGLGHLDEAVSSRLKRVIPHRLRYAFSLF